MVNKRSKSTRIAAIQDRREQYLHIRQHDDQPEYVWEARAQRGKA